MRRILSLITISCVMFWTASSSNHGQTAGATVEVIDGIEYIHNTETPLYPDKTVTFIEELSLGGGRPSGRCSSFCSVMVYSR